jgi:hypothetical protein
MIMTVGPHVLEVGERRRDVNVEGKMVHTKYGALLYAYKRAQDRVKRR